MEFQGEDGVKQKAVVTSVLKSGVCHLKLASGEAVKSVEFESITPVGRVTRSSTRRKKAAKSTASKPVRKKRKPRRQAKPKAKRVKPAAERKASEAEEENVEPNKGGRKNRVKYAEPTESEIDEEFMRGSSAEDETEESDEGEKLPRIDKVLQSQTLKSEEWKKVEDSMKTLKKLETEAAKKVAEGEEVTKYLVKWRGLSYLHLTWSSEAELLEETQDERQVKLYIDKFLAQPAVMDEEIEHFQQIHRIIDSFDDDKVMVKWHSLGYEDCSVESKEDLLKFTTLENLEMETSLLQQRVARKTPKKGLVDKNYSSSREFKNGKKLRSYQVEAVNWMTFNLKNGRNSILADEMGLGKTCQSVAFVHRLFHSLNAPGPFLVIGPLATLPHWIREFESWTDFNTVLYHGSFEGRKLIREKEMRSHVDVFVTNYETVMTDAKYLKKFDWSLLIVDEAHRLKNSESKLCLSLKEEFRWGRTLLLTGTPIQNSLPELWSLLNFIQPEKFPQCSAFESEWGDMTSAEKVAKFHDMLRPYMLRRIKAEVEKLPDRNDILVEVELTTLQKRFYRAIYERNAEYLAEGVTPGTRINLNNIVMQLRKVCCHPYLIQGVEDKLLSEKPPSNEADSELKHLVDSSGKMLLLDKLLPKLKQQGHRVLIFSQMTRMLDILEDYLNLREFGYERIDGSVRGIDRQSAIDRFSSATSDKFCFLLSTRGCGQGINLTAADTVIMYDGDWNPQNDIQALARCHRIGQEREVTVYRLITRKTYEYQMFYRASRKLGFDQAVMTGITKVEGKKESQKKSKKEQDKEMERLLKYGAYHLNDDDTDAIDFEKQDIETILKTRSKTINAKEINHLSKATFVSSVDDKNKDVDVDDPAFWSKVVGLKAAKKKAEEEYMSMYERAKKRSSKKVVNYKEVLRIQPKEEDESDSDAETEKQPTASELKRHFRNFVELLRGFGMERYQSIADQIEDQEITPERVKKNCEAVLRRCLKEFLKVSEQPDKPKPQASQPPAATTDPAAPMNTSEQPMDPATMESQANKKEAQKHDCVASLKNYIEVDVHEAVIPSYQRASLVKLHYPHLYSFVSTWENDDLEETDLSDFEDTYVRSQARAILRDLNRMCSFNLHMVANEIGDLSHVEKSVEFVAALPTWTAEDDVRFLKGLHKHGWILCVSKNNTLEQILGDEELRWKEQFACSTKAVKALLKTRAYELTNGLMRNDRMKHLLRWTKAEMERIYKVISKQGIPNDTESRLKWKDLFEQSNLPRKTVPMFKEVSLKLVAEAKQMSRTRKELQGSILTLAKADKLVESVKFMNLLRNEVLPKEDLEGVVNKVSNHIIPRLVPYWWTRNDNFKLLRLINKHGMYNYSSQPVLRESFKNPRIQSRLQSFGSLAAAGQKENGVNVLNTNTAGSIPGSTELAMPKVNPMDECPQYNILMRHFMQLVRAILRNEASASELDSSFKPILPKTFDFKTKPVLTKKPPLAAKNTSGPTVPSKPKIECLKRKVEQAKALFAERCKTPTMMVTIDGDSPVSTSSMLGSRRITTPKSGLSMSSSSSSGFDSD